MRFLHAADLHLGLKVTRFGAEVNGKVQEARLKSMETMFDRAKSATVDFVLIAGDLFDDNQVDAATSRRAFEMLEALLLPSFIIPGNHDPLTANSVFARSPWTKTNDRVHVLRNRDTIPVPGAKVLACPLFAKNSHTDPTAWMPPREPGDNAIRIGLAHGSLKDRPTLPVDDHLIDRFVVDEKGLDYLALGHWHSPQRHEDRGGVVRTAYPGLHEPKGFHEAPDFAIGWSAYSAASAADLFAGDGKGRALIVTIDRPGAAPIIEEIETGRLHWRDETRTLRDESELSALIDELGRRNNQESELLRLHLHGTLPAAAVRRLDELDARLSGGQGGVLSRYFWADLDIASLFAEPAEDELQAIAGDGVIRAVHDRLKADSQSPDPAVKERARQSLLLLYRFAQEVGR